MMIAVSLHEGEFRSGASSRRAFTLIELLVVIGIIALLAGLLFVAGRMAREAARSSVTKIRIDEALRAISTLSEGDNGGTAAVVLHRRLRAMAPTVVRGVGTFISDQRSNHWYPAAGESWIQPPYRPYEFAHPWGKPPTDLPGDAPAGPPPVGAILPVEPHALSELTPVISEELLFLGDILENERFPSLVEARRAYRTDRSKSAGWNDGWGRPLVVGFGLYHPRKNTTIAFKALSTDSGGISEDLFLRNAKPAYGYTKSIYLAIGAVGPELPASVVESEIISDTADWTSAGSGVIDRLWIGINMVVNRTAGVERWRTDGTFNPFTTPPWSDVDNHRVESAVMFLSAPLEVQ